MNTRQFFVGKTVGFIIVVVAALVIYFFVHKKQEQPAPVVVTNFTECVAAGNAVMESYPRQCTSKDGQHFTEDIGNTLEKSDLIRLTTPRPNDIVTSPLTLKGEARGTWFFEASFPIMITDWDGKIIGQGHATADGDWMTTDFVPFTATITFNTAEISGQYSNRGTLILQKDNPSGLPEHDDAMEIPVRFNLPLN